MHSTIKTFDARQLNNCCQLSWPEDDNKSETLSACKHNGRSHRKKDFGQAWRQIQGQCFVNLSENIGERQTKHDITGTEPLRKCVKKDFSQGK